VGKIDPTNPMVGSAARILTAAMIGGVASDLSGGKFAHGAVTAAFARAFNEEMQNKPDKGEIEVLGSSEFKEAVDQVEAAARKAGIGIFDELRSGSAKVYIQEHELTQTAITAKGEYVVRWDSDEGALVAVGPHHAAVQSPALGLIHELGHVQQAQLGVTHRKADLVIIPGIERQWARHFGEPIRTNNLGRIHGGETREGMGLFDTRGRFTSR
jgi:hypothetical protein